MGGGGLIFAVFWVFPYFDNTPRQKAGGAKGREGCQKYGLTTGIRVSLFGFTTQHAVKSPPAAARAAVRFPPGPRRAWGRTDLRTFLG